MRLRCWHLSLVVLLVFLAPARAFADYDRSRLWFNGLSDWERRGIQTNLILTGFYSGFADAKFGRNTYEALLAFESRHSIFPNGILSGFESGRLVQLAQRWRDGMQFRDERDALAGVVLPIPHALVGASKGGERGAIWDGNNGVRVETAGYAIDDLSFDVVYALMSIPKSAPA